MHQGVAKVPMGSGFLIDEILTQDMIPAHVDHVFTGHYHQHNRVNPQITVVGSTMQHNWSDEGDPRGYVWYDTETGKIEHVRVEAPCFVTIDFDAGQGLTPTNNFVRVKNCPSEKQDEYRKMIMNMEARSVEFVSKIVEPKRLKHSIAGGFHLPSLVEKYTLDQEIDDDRSKVGKELMK